jgi:hypothetical protein
MDLKHMMRCFTIPRAVHELGGRIIFLAQVDEDLALIFHFHQTVAAMGKPQDRYQSKPSQRSRSSTSSHVASFSKLQIASLSRLPESSITETGNVRARENRYLNRDGKQ